MIGFLPSLSTTEMFVLVVVGLLLYGRNLPEAGRSLGKVVAQLRRGWHEFKEQMDKDGDLREVKNSLKGTAEELRRAAEVKRTIADPRRAIDNMARDALAPPPDEVVAPPVDDAKSSCEGTARPEPKE